ncbi:MAG: elongation factor G, partial [Thermodesulfobacteriota bacterium]|nr:elongation factor G [Thermodesulfobacteriota bacterium]
SKVDEETGQTIISGMGELHLEIVVHKLKRDCNLDVNVGKPEVVYRETIAHCVESEGKFIREVGGKMHYGHVFLRLEPTPRGEGITTVFTASEEKIPKTFHLPIEVGIRNGSSFGPLGYSVVDLKVTVFDGSFDESTSTELGYEVASSIAFKEGCAKATSLLLEPIMDVSVAIPEEFMGEVIGNLNAKQAKLEGIEPKGKKSLIHVYIPLREMFGYSTQLRSMTQGRGTFSMHFSHFDMAVERQKLSL